MKNIRTNMSISMPQKLKNFVKTRTEKEFYGTPSDYIRALIRKELQKKEEQERLEKIF